MAVETMPIILDRILFVMNIYQFFNYCISVINIAQCHLYYLYSAWFIYKINLNL